MRTDFHTIKRRLNASAFPDKGSSVSPGSAVMDSIIDATALVAGIAETTRILAGDKPVSVELITPDLPVMVTTDPVKLRRIVTHLVVNALRATERGKITIALKVIGRITEIVVTDTGSGYRSHRSAHPAASADRAVNGGSGVDEATIPGLTADRDLARLIGGSISVRSVYGRGAMFTLTLSLRSADRRRELYAVE